MSAGTLSDKTGNKTPESGNEGMVVWITGLSGSGKTTLAGELVKRLKVNQDNIVTLDGDELREVFGAVSSNSQNHSRNARLILAFQYAHLCRVLAAQGLTVVIATISMFREIHKWNRNNLPGYFEVYLKVPIEELRHRDPKGIYRQFDAGELTDVAGLDLSVDEPRAADCVIEFTSPMTINMMVTEIFDKLKNRIN